MSKREARKLDCTVQIIHALQRAFLYYGLGEIRLTVLEGFGAPNPRSATYRSVLKDWPREGMRIPISTDPRDDLQVRIVRLGGCGFRRFVIDRAEFEPAPWDGPAISEGDLQDTIAKLFRS